MKRNNKWTTSTNGEIFNGEEFDTKAEAIAHMHADLDEGDPFSVGQMEELYVGEFIDIDYLIESMSENANERVGEVSEDWLYPFPKEEKEELHQIITAWFEKKGYSPTFYAIKNTEQFKAKK